MKVSERIELMWLQKYKPRTRVEPLKEIAEICTKCPGRCKASVELKVCGKQVRDKTKK
jgi:hypothetical protein